MASKNKKKPKLPSRIAADNRKARHLFSIEQEHEAGLMLVGTEIKSLRGGKSNLADSYAEAKNGELWLVNAYIPELAHAGSFNHDARRPRKLLMHKREINRLAGAVQRDGMTLVPLRIYYNDKGVAKVLLGLAKGKRAHDKRETEKNRDWQRQKSRIMKENS